MHLRSSAALLVALTLTINMGPRGNAQEEATFTTNTRLVILPAIVQDKSGHLITNLTQGQFQVFEDGAPQPIKLFKREDVLLRI